MKKIKFVGPVPRSVTVPALGVSLEVGDEIEVDDGAAQALCEQDCWQYVDESDAKKADKADVAASKKADKAADNAQEG